MKRLALSILVCAAVLMGAGEAWALGRAASVPIKANETESFLVDRLRLIERESANKIGAGRLVRLVIADNVVEYKEYDHSDIRCRLINAVSPIKRFGEANIELNRLRELMGTFAWKQSAFGFGIISEIPISPAKHDVINERVIFDSMSSLRPNHDIEGGAFPDVLYRSADLKIDVRRVRSRIADDFQVLKDHPCSVFCSRKLSCSIEGFAHKVNTDSAYYKAQYAKAHGSPKHPETISGHIFLCLQIFLGALCVPVGAYYAFKAVPKLVEDGDIGTFFLKLALYGGIASAGSVIMVSGLLNL